MLLVFLLDFSINSTALVTPIFTKLEKALFPELSSANAFKLSPLKLGVAHIVSIISTYNLHMKFIISWYNLTIINA